MRQISLIILITFLSNILILKSQQDAQFSQYMFSQQYFNPAVVGATENIDISLIHRNQWLGYSPTNYSGKSPITQYINFMTPLELLKGGVGGYLINDQLGNIRNTYVKLSYAYRIKLNNNSLLAVGGSGGFYNLSADSKYIFNDPNDPNINTSSFQQSKPDFNFGVWYKNQKFYLGASTSHLSSPKFTYNSSKFITLGMHYFLTGGYEYQINDNLVLKPSILLKTDSKIKNLSFDINTNLHIKNKYWAGLMYRYQESIGTLLGVSFLKNNALRLGYAFEYTLNGQKAKAGTSHELMLSYIIPALKSGTKPIIRTPRYRYN